LGFVWPEIENIISQLSHLKEVKKIIAAGSIRRMKETIGDLDILIISNNPTPVMDYFVSMPNVFQIIAHGETKSAIRLKNGLDVDLRVVAEESFGAALNYFTGSKNHGIHLREIAMKKNNKLNEYGLFKIKNNKEIKIAGKTEKEIYQALV
jgi:DNA polymerase (family 10)